MDPYLQVTNLLVEDTTILILIMEKMRKKFEILSKALNHNNNFTLKSICLMQISCNKIKDQ